MTTTQHPTPPPAQAVGTDDRHAGRPWLVVAVREIVVRVTNRTFLFSTLFTLVFIAGFAASRRGRAGKTSTYTVAVSTSEGSRLVGPGGRAARARQRQGRHHPEHPWPVRTRRAPRSRPATSTRGSHQNGIRLCPHLRRRRPRCRCRPPRGRRSRRGARPQRGTAGTTVEALERGVRTLTTDRFDARRRTGLRAGRDSSPSRCSLPWGAICSASRSSERASSREQSRLVEIIATAIPLRALLARQGRRQRAHRARPGGAVLRSWTHRGLVHGVVVAAADPLDRGDLVRPLSSPSASSALACLFAVAGALASRTEGLQSTTSR